MKSWTELEKHEEESRKSQLLLSFSRANNERLGTESDFDSKSVTKMRVGCMVNCACRLLVV